MAESITIEAPAKLNLHLGIGGPRPDGYHPIASIFQAISLADTVSVSIAARPGIELRCECDCPPERNTMYRAAEAFLGAMGAKGRAMPGLALEAVKRIPAGAGMGGGSSDAAAVLKALDALFPGAVSRESLLGIAAGVGSDVPFFLGSACAAVRGRGELLDSLEARTDYFLAVACPDLHLATGPAYAALDAYRQETGEPPSADALERGLEAACGSYRTADPSRWPFHNDFYPALSRLFPVLAELVAAMRSEGASFAAMTGSGSAVFGVFPDSVRSRAAARSMGAAGLRTIEAFPLARLPLSV